jgi:hypothetical protein
VREHSGLSIDNSFRPKANDLEGMKRLAEYLARFPSPAQAVRGESSELKLRMR